MLAATSPYFYTLLKIPSQNLQSQIAELQAQLNANSHNSNNPPSSDLPFKRPPKKAKEKSSKTKGGQVGHTRHLRELVPLDSVDEIIEIYPQACQYCHIPLRSSNQIGVPLRHQVWELLPVKASVKEYQFFTW